MRRVALALWALCALVGCSDADQTPAGVAKSAAAQTALVAVATNFSSAMRRLEQDFVADSPHRLTVVFGSSGKLYAQILQGAPFDVFLSADQERPERLVEVGRAQARSRFTYAIGRLVLWSADPALLVRDPERVLGNAQFRNLAIANPDLAPYGRAAVQALRSLGLHENVSDKLVLGENVGQTHAMIATGNAQLGFVALSLLVAPGSVRSGSSWEVPSAHYEPVRQDAVLLDVNNPAAREFLDYLRSAGARAHIASYGYDLEPLLPSE